jgi:cellulose biosynthesis protein BcsQ
MRRPGHRFAARTGVLPGRGYDRLGQSRRLRGGDKPRCVIVPNRIDGRTTIARELCRYEVFGERVSPPIHMRTAFAKAFDTGQWIGNFAPGSAAHREIETLAELVAGGYSAAPTPVGF